MANEDINNGAPDNDDDKLLLLNENKPKAKVGSKFKSRRKLNTEKDKKEKDDKKKEKEKEITFCQWLWSKPWNKLPFMYMLIGIVAVPGLAVFHFMDPDTSFIMCGAYIVLNIFAMKHFYTLIGLKAVCFILFILSVHEINI